MAKSVLAYSYISSNGQSGLFSYLNDNIETPEFGGNAKLTLKRWQDTKKALDAALYVQYLDAEVV